MISEEKQNLIRMRLLSGFSVRAISEEVGVSEATVKRYKKKMPKEKLAENTGDNCITWDNKLSKIEARYAERIKKEIWLYEDPTEGWVYHISKYDCRLKTSGLWWWGIAYPESVDECWIERLRATGLGIAISPLHDKDVWGHDSPEVVDPSTGAVIPKGARYKAGQRKKAHWHFIITSDTRMSAVEVNNLIRPITNGPYLQKLRSLKNGHGYFVHINNPEKYQGYDKSEILTYNNFHITPNKYEVGIMQDEILQTIKEKNFVNMDEIIDYYMGNPEYITILFAKPGLISSYINSRWKKANPEGRVQRVLLVTENDLNGGK